MVGNAPLEVRRDHDRDVRIALPHELAQLGVGARLADLAEHLRGAEVPDQAPRQRSARLVEDHGLEPAHVEVDRIAKQQELQRRQADDQADRDAVTRELAHFLGRDREQAPQPTHAARSGCAPSLRSRVAATNTSSSEAPTRSTEAPGLPSASAARMSRSGSGVPRGSRIRSRLPSWATLRTAETARERAPRGGEVDLADLDHDCVNVAGEDLRLALRGHTPGIQDREPVTALGLVHVVGRNQDRRAAPDQLEQAFPEVPAALRIDGAGRLIEQQELRVVQGRRAEREALALAAGERARALGRDALEVVAAHAVGDPLADLRAVEPVYAAHELAGSLGP